MFNYSVYYSSLAALSSYRICGESDAAAQREIRKILDDPRRVFIHLQARELPLIPLLMGHKLNLGLGSGLDLRQRWESLREKLMQSG